jgi:hypothetical protein
MTNAIDRVVRLHGIGGYVARMAQEFGDHPDTAAERMHRARWAYGSGGRPAAGTALEPDVLGPAVHSPTRAQWLRRRCPGNSQARRWNATPPGDAQRSLHG